MKTRCVFILGLATLLLLGCSDNKEDLHSYVATVRKQSAPKIEPIPQVTQYTPYTYAAGDRRPPFTSVAATPETRPSSTSGLRPDMNRPLDPLEQFPLDSLSMVGSLTVNGMRYALIHAPDDVVYRARVGAHAGHDYGEITTITGHLVQLSEIVPDGRGGFMRSPASIPLSQ